MATIHPSRMGLVPQDSREIHAVDGRRGRSLSPRRSRRTPSRSKSRDNGYRRNDEDRRRSRSRDRRRSPEYEAYKRASPPRQTESAAPWRQQENMYQSRRDRQPLPGYGGGGSDYFDRLVLILCGYLSLSTRVQQSSSAEGCVNPERLAIVAETPTEFVSLFI
jgi:hypothetical protein